MSTTALVLLIIVIALAALAAAFAVLQRIAENRHPPAGEFIDHDGVRLHYVETGVPAGETVVLLHGNGSMIQDFASSGLVELLSPRYRVLCFDRPGFGHSSRPRTRPMTPEAQAELLAAALERLGVRTPHLVGHSWGTLVALALAFRAEPAVRGLVLAGGYYFPTRRWDAWLMAGPALPLVGDVLRYTIVPLLGWLLAPVTIRNLFAPQPVPARFAAEFPLALALRPKQLRATAEEAVLMVPGAARLARRYPDLPCPIEVFHATGDRVVEPDQAPRLHGLAPASVLHIVHDAGHMMHHAIPEDLAAAVDRLHRGAG
jgi:pimeloyl-ACP methyl ester carboxylesterase